MNKTINTTSILSLPTYWLDPVESDRVRAWPFFLSLHNNGEATVFCGNTASAMSHWLRASGYVLQTEYKQEGVNNWYRNGGTERIMENYWTGEFVYQNRTQWPVMEW